MSDGFRPCVLIPTYDNPETIRGVVERAAGFGPPVLVIDDGSGPHARQLLEAIAADGLAQVERRDTNGGKGAAVKTGFVAAAAAGHTHALQVDADGQHDLDDIPRFLDEARDHPDALILGYPVFDETQPAGRAFARQISVFWVNREVGTGVIRDPQCGFRVYPLAAAMAAEAGGDHMEFDQELPVRMAWAGVPIRNLATRVRYLAPEEGGVSHFDLLRDNLRISWLHTRLSIRAGLAGLFGGAGSG
ncbi:MAG: glycosyltransferase family 2 protein [Myxococcota bacterium]